MNLFRRFPVTSVYVVLTLGAIGFLLYDDLFVEHPDASFAALPAVFVTMPGSLLYLAATPEGPWIDTAWGQVAGYAALLLAGLTNASVLAYAERRRSHPRGAPPPDAWHPARE